MEIMLTYCLIDPFLVDLARKPKVVQQNASDADLSLHELPQMATTNTHYSLAKSFIKRIANRHILCDFFRGEPNSRSTPKYRKFFENCVFPDDNEFDVYWREFPLKQVLISIQKEIKQAVENQQYRALLTRWPEGNTIDEIALKLGYLLACVTELDIFVVMLSETMALLDEIIEICEIQNMQNILDCIKRIKQKCVVITLCPTDPQSGVTMELDGNLDVLEKANFLFSNDATRKGITIGFNLAGLKKTSFVKDIISPLADTFQNENAWYLITYSKPENQLLQFWQNDLGGSLDNIITKESFPQDQKQRWHDRFIVFSSGPRSQGTRYGHRFVALVFSAPLEHILETGAVFRQGTCVLRCSSDEDGPPWECIASFLACFNSGQPPGPTAEI